MTQQVPRKTAWRSKFAFAGVFVQKVEELVKAAKACVPIAENAGLGPPGPTTDQEDVERLNRAIREVEAELNK